MFLDSHPTLRSELSKAVAMIGDYEQMREEKEMEIRHLQVTTHTHTHTHTHNTHTRAHNTHVHTGIEMMKSQTELKCHEAQIAELRLLNTELTAVQSQLEEQQKRYLMGY